MSENQNEDLKVKDLLIKLQILSNGLIDERKKSQSYLDRLKEYEESLEKKDLEIADLTKQKFELKSKLSLEKSKTFSGKNMDKFYSSVYNKKDSDGKKLLKLEEKLNQQNFEIKDLTQRLMEERELFDQQKIQFQTMITIQNQQMMELKKKYENAEKEENEKKLKEENEKKLKEEKEKEEKEKKLKEEKEKKEKEEKDKKEKEEKEKEEREQREKKLIEDKEKDEKEKETFKIEISEHKAKIDYLNRQFNNERDQYEKKLGQLRDELRDEKEKRETLDKQLVQYKQQCETKNYENMAMKAQVKKLNDDLNKLRGDFHNKQLTPRLFQVERIKMVGIVKQKKTMVIIFDWNKKKNVCEMKFQRSQTGGKVKEDIVNILDIAFKEDKNKEIIDITFKVSYIIIILLLIY